MASPVGVSRVVIVVLDGLRPDAVDRLDLHNWKRLAARGASTLSASTVTPSVTAAAMASLLTGASPAVHGLQSDRFHIPRRTGAVSPVPRCLRGAGIPTSAFIRCIPFLFRGVATAMTKMLGVADPHFVGTNSLDIVGAARHRLRERRPGLVLLHLPDADQAGHADGWMSDSYCHAARRLDEALGLIAAFSHADEDPATLLIALADHGGGGAVANDHDSNHPLDTTIPILLSGAAVRPSTLPAHSSLLDVPATTLWTFGIPIPAGYAGTPLVSAFVRMPMAA
jgi:arylsulfatase A-like enzyme